MNRQPGPAAAQSAPHAAAADAATADAAVDVAAQSAIAAAPGPATPDAAAAHVAVESAAEFIRQRWAARPRAGMILGTGMGDLARLIDDPVVIPYSEIPEFPRSTAVGHRGQLVCGRLEGRPIVAMEGRFHFYEGYTAEQVTLPVRVMHRLGVELLIASNASGGLNPRFQSGDVMIVREHINMMGARTARLAATSSGPCRSCPRPLYDPELIALALATSRRRNFSCHQGTYLGVLGPNYETRAEYRMMRRLGADAIGMSTVPEALVASQCGLRVLALSMIANVARPDVPLRVDAHEVLDAAATAAPHMYEITRQILTALSAAT